MKRLFANIDDQGVKRVWYTERLWELAKGLPVKDVPIEGISAFDEVTWFGNQEPTCRNVTDHAKRIYEASFEHPVILSAEGYVMDGMHRICRAHLLGQKTVKAVRFEPNPVPDETVTEQAEVRRLVEAYSLSPHPEGGYYAESYRAKETVATPAGPRSASTAIYFLLPAGTKSRLHRIKSDEVWHFYLGGPLRIIQISPEGRVAEVVLGRDAAVGQRLQHVVPAGTWFGALPEPESAFSFVGCTVAPGFDFADFELGETAALLAAFPAARGAVERLA